MFFVSGEPEEGGEEARPDGPGAPTRLALGFLESPPEGGTLAP